MRRKINHIHFIYSLSNGICFTHSTYLTIHYTLTRTTVKILPFSLSARQQLCLLTSAEPEAELGCSPSVNGAAGAGSLATSWPSPASSSYLVEKAAVLGLQAARTAPSSAMDRHLAALPHVLPALSHPPCCFEEPWEVLLLGCWAGGSLRVSRPHL